MGKTTLKTESLTILLYSPYCLKWGAPHLRHSKAMGLLKAGVNLIYIRDFLGHVNVVTTEIYARADSEMKRKAIESAYVDLSPKDMPRWDKSQDLMYWLQNLCK